MAVEAPAVPAAYDASARFDVGDAAAADPAPDLTTALNGAEATEAGQAATQHRPGEAKPAGEDVTSRLLRAKRRARRDMDEQPNEGKGP